MKAEPRVAIPDFFTPSFDQQRRDCLLSNFTQTVQHKNLINIFKYLLESLSIWATFSVNLAYILFLGFNDIKRLIGISKVCGGSQPHPKRLTWIQVTLLTLTFYYDAARSQVFVSG